MDFVAGDGLAEQFALHIFTGNFYISHIGRFALNKVKEVCMKNKEMSDWSKPKGVFFYESHHF
jgi:hypothetical protein